MIRFDEKFRDELLSKLNIVDVIGSYCSLQRRGGTYWACCPLPGHSERTPSFAVNEAGQFYKCFGCGRGGNVITFIMEMESVDYHDAMVLLCERAHMPLPEDDGQEKSAFETKKKFTDKKRLTALMRDAALFYVSNLKSDQAKKHRDYLQKRGLTKKEIVGFGLGASTDYNSLVNHLKEKGYSYEEMVQSGAVQYSKEKGNYFDAVANRLIFPIIDAFGNVIAFGGRVIEKTDFAKYKNTGDTPIFNKRKTLYNLNGLKKEKQAVGKLNYVVMVEGYMDTIALHKAGFRSVVASMGTSLTVEQARLLKRYTDVVLICYDGDSAGQNATVRGLEILLNNGLEVRVVSLPDGLDPDELISQRGKEEYEKCLNNALPLVDFKLKLVRDGSNVNTVSGKRRYIEESLRIISKCENLTLQEELLKKLRDESGLTYDSLKRDLDRFKGEDGASVTALSSSTDYGGSFSGSNTEIAERFVLCAYVFSEPYAKKLPDECLFSDKFREELMQFVTAKIMLNKPIEQEKLQDFAGEDNLSELMKVLAALSSVEESAREEYFNDCLLLLKRNAALRELASLKERFNNEQNREQRMQIAKRISELTVVLNKLK
ncbi:MAG: DNA primase [Clostridia bacterium]|nr:DNA primase [Clostridia bacterium]